MIDSKIKIMHRPEQRGEWDDYYLAIFEGEIGEGVTAEKAKQDLLNKISN